MGSCPDAGTLLPADSRSAEQVPASALFRAEAIGDRARLGMGEILLNHPPTHWLWTLCAAALIAGVIAFVVLGEYTRKEHVSGQLVLSHQSVKQYAPSVGTIVERLVQDGAAIRQGDPLFRITVDRVIQGRGDVQAAILRGIESRRSDLLIEQQLLQRILSEEESTLRQRIASLREQLERLDGEIGSQQRRLGLNAENLARTRQLAAQEIVSAVELQDKEQEHLNLQGQLDALRRNRAALQQELGNGESDLRNAPLKARSQISALDRGVRELDQQAVDTESRRELVVVALTDGVVTGLLVDVGQQVSQSSPLLSILPRGATLEAQLNVPTRAIGFLQPGGQVLLRYQAFPYQKFGQHVGRIRSIARTTFSPTDLQLLGEAKEQYYRVLVTLAEQQVLAYGQRVPLHDGMQLEADLAVDTRRLYEWVLEPLYTLSGRY